MTPEERSMLERAVKLSEENNDILRSLRRHNRASVAFRLAYWVVILILSFGAYYFIQPYFSLLSNISSNGTSTMENAQNAADTLRQLLQ